MTKETIEHCISILEWYSESSSGKEGENAQTNAQALAELDSELMKAI